MPARWGPVSYQPYASRFISMRSIESQQRYLVLNSKWGLKAWSHFKNVSSDVES
jgi:hypothetical protein